MARTDSDREELSLSSDGGEYIAHSRPRHGIRSRTRRLLFFALTASWGFLVGVTGLVGSLGMAQVPVRMSSGVLEGLAVSIVVALTGAWVFASAYEEAKRR